MQLFIRVLKRELKCWEYDGNADLRENGSPICWETSKRYDRCFKFLMTTEVGGRGGGAERAAEWDERVDQEGEELLDSM